MSCRGIPVIYNRISYLNCLFLIFKCSAATGTDGVDTWNRPAPGFVAAASNIYRLSSSSALIDKGVNTHLPESLTKDIEGEARISGENVDLGAFEYQK